MTFSLFLKTHVVQNLIPFPQIATSSRRLSVVCFNVGRQKHLKQRLKIISVVEAQTFFKDDEF